MKSHTTRKSLGFVLVLTLGLLIAAPGRLPRMFATEAAAMFATQATITVNSTADGAPANNGACTLREALMNANGANQSGSTDCAAGGTTTNTITFSLPAGPQTITLNGALPDITRSLTITGPGAGLLTVTRPPGVYNNSATWYRIFTIPIGGLNIAISGLTVSNGYLNGMGGSGGGIRSYSNLTLTNCAIANNTSLAGGGVDVGGADGVFTGCTFSGNWSANTGGAITFGGNTLRMINSTISNNFGSSGGGGILNGGNTVEVTNCTIANNTQYQNGSGLGSGILTGAGTTRLRNTIFANNNWPNLRTTGSASIVSLGNNLTSDDGGGVLNQPGDKINTDPLLGPLGNYGGTTQTRELLPGSAALNAGNNCVLTNTCASNNLGYNLTTDQRGVGFNRRVGSAVDMGAFEMAQEIAVYTGASTAAANERASNVGAYIFSNTTFGTTSAAQTFTIKNAGNANLTGIAVTMAGANPGDFVLNASGVYSALLPGSTTTFTVSFRPTAYGVRNAVVKIASNDTDENPFLINISGAGVNSAPTITASSSFNLRRGNSANVTIATVTDYQDAWQSLAVTVNGGASATVNGVTVRNLTNTNGQIKANMTADCNATNASFTLTVRDSGGATASAIYTMTTSNNFAPSAGTYPNTVVTAGGSTTVTPTIRPSDSGSIASITATASPNTFTGTISMASLSGALYVGNANPPGNYTVTVKVTDNCGASAYTTFALTVNCPTITVGPLLPLAAGIEGVPYSQTFTQTGGTGSITWSSTGALPAGLALNSSTGVLAGTPTAAGSFTFTIQARDANNCTGSREYIAVVAGTALAFYPLTSPVRLLDTRAGFSGCDAPGEPIAGGTSRTLLARRSCKDVTIPADAMAVTGNVTTVQSGGGSLTLYPSGVAQPPTASSNFSPNEVQNTSFTVALGGADGAFEIFASADTDVVVDITGYYAPPASGGLYFHPLPKPVRLLETRAGQPGCYAPGVALAAGSDSTQFATGGCAGVTIPARAQALVGNATTVGPQAGGHLTFHSGKAERPLAANANFAAGQSVNALFTVGLSPAGTFNIYTSSETELVIDVLGYYSAEASDENGAGLLFTPLPSPVRLQETRGGQDGEQTIANMAAAIVGTVINAREGDQTARPGAAVQPFVATRNFAAGQILNRHFTAGLVANGMFGILATAQTDVIIEVSGYFAPRP